MGTIKLRKAKDAKLGEQKEDEKQSKQLVNQIANEDLKAKVRRVEQLIKETAGEDLKEKIKQMEQLTIESIDDSLRRELKATARRVPFVDGGAHPRRRTDVVKTDPSILFEEKNLSGEHEKYYRKNNGTLKRVVLLKTENYQDDEMYELNSCAFKLNFNKLNIQDYPIASAKLIFSMAETTGCGDFIYDDGTATRTINSDGNSELEIDITDKIKSQSIDFEFETQSSDESTILPFAEIRAEIEYITNEKVIPTEKEIPLVGGASAKVDLYSGETRVSFTDVAATDSLLGVGISHTHKITGGNYYSGENFRLSLYERFEKVSNNALDANFVYTDSEGTKHGFKDTYYYFDSAGNKTLINQTASIDIDLDGNLSYNGREVIKEQHTATGLKAITQLEDFDGSNLLETRTAEQKEIEEKIKTYEDTLNQFILTDENGAIKKSDSGELSFKLALSSNYVKNFFGEAIKDGAYILAENEATQLRSLISQKEALTKECDATNIIPNQTVNIPQQILALKSSIYEITKTLKDCTLTAHLNDGFAQLPNGENNEIMSYLYQNNAFIPSEQYEGAFKDNNFYEAYSISNATEEIKNLIPKVNGRVVKEQFRQRNLLLQQLEMQEAELNRQLTSIQEQISIILGKKEQRLQQVQEYYKEYVNLKNQLKQLQRQLPVNYLTDGTIIKGFNEDGQLVAVYDRYENYVAIEYDDDGKITGVYEGEDKQISFAYSEDLLVSLTDKRGNKTLYEYNDKKQLINVLFANGKSLKFTYDDNSNISSVESSDQDGCELEYSSGLVSVCGYNAMGGISHGNPIASNSMKTLIDTYITYEGNKTTVADIYQNTEIYIFNSDTNLEEYYEEHGGVVTKAEKYAYTAYSSKRVVSARKDSLYKTSFANYNFISGDITTVNLDEMNKPVKQQTNARQISENSTVQTSVDYEYDDEHRCIKETEIVTYSLPSADGTNTETQYSHITKYSYNAAGSLVRKESYVEGEEYTTGKTIEETVYDEKGNKVKSFVYNTLDSSSKLYTESEYSENGQISADKDEAGETAAEYEYVKGTNVVRSVKFANGSKFSYGRDVDDTVTAITQSTAEGEENSTQISYTRGEITELRSGNNVIHYGYTYRRELNTIELNGTQYMTYSNNRSSTGNTQIIFNAKNDLTFSMTDAQGNILDLYYKENDDSQLVQQMQCTYVNNLITQFSDKIMDETSTYAYDELLRIKQFTRGEYTEETVYNEYGSISEQTRGERKYTYTYKDNAAHSLESVTTDGFSFYPQTDCLGRNTGREIKSGETTLAAEYLYYRKVGDHATNMPSSVYFGGMKNGKYAVTDNVKYEYDKNGNICKIFENGALVARYEYDSIDRIIREDNKPFGTTTLFSYDNCGNITSKRTTKFTLKTDVEECEFTETHYSYNGDQLVSFGEETFEYDIIGNPEVYRNKTLVWKKGRQLKKFGELEFLYDAQGWRRTKGEIQFTYDSNGNLIKQSNGLEFFYDNAGIAGIAYNGATYLFRKDAQGNISAILDSAGNVVVKYVYDAWGNHAVLNANGIDITDETNIGNLNPFRYRSYYYDVETGLYYLQTRYYDPELCRFITIDGIEYLDPEHINGLNLYAYCGNNPVMATDPMGTTEWWEWLISALIAIIVIVAVVAVTIATAGIGTAIGGALGGGIAATIFGSAAGGAITGAITGAIMSFGISVISQGLSNGYENISLSKVGIDTLIGAGSGAALGAVFGAIGGTAKVFNAARAWASTSSKSSLKVMSEHYVKHVIQEGQQGVVKNIINYTNQAKSFYTANLSRGYQVGINAIKIKGAPGGIFTFDGLIKSFWYI